MYAKHGILSIFSPIKKCIFELSILTLFSHCIVLNIVQTNIVQLFHSQKQELLISVCQLENVTQNYTDLNIYRCITNEPSINLSDIII